MRLTDASVAIRPRSAWEALDLGVLLARRHAGLLMASWALVTLPIFAVLCAMLWESPGWAILAFWWLKPAFERLPLYILGRALFGDTPTLQQALKAWPGLLRPQLLASLTWRRLSPSRSFDLPVLQLEGLAGQTRSARLAVLGQRDASAATWLTLVGVHLEMALWLGLIGLFYLLLPQQIELDWGWQSLIQASASDWLWLEHLSNLLYALVLVLWEPVYVACGFSLYLNRRTALEAWDIELTFRRLRQRLTGLAYGLLLGLGLVLAQAPGPALAADTSSCALPAEDPHGPEAPRLLKQPLSSQGAQQSIGQLLDAPPFEHREIVTRWRLGEAEPAEQATDLDLQALLERLRKLVEYWQHLDSLALFFEVLLWASLFGLLLMLVRRYRDWLGAFVGRPGAAPRAAAAPPSQLFGLEVTPQSLPADVPGEVERLWAEQPRAALGLLYRALLSRLLHDYRVPLNSAHTEAELLQLVHQLEQEDVDDFSRTLIHHWQNLAYGHRLPPDELRVQLCDAWRRLFAGEVRA